MGEATEDLKTLRNWVLGIISFATAVSTVLVQVLHFRPEPTIIAVAGFACALVLIVVLIQKSENRQRKLVENHIKDADSKTKALTQKLDNIDGILLDIQKSTLRTEMCNEMDRHPENHDTILKMAEKYFGKKANGGLEANWYMSSKFLDWASEERVKLPKSLQGVERD